MAAVPRRCARTGARFLIRKRVRRYDSSHPSLADTLKDLVVARAVMCVRAPDLPSWGSDSADASRR